MSSFGDKYQFYHWLCIGTRNTKIFKLQFLFTCTWDLCPWPFQWGKNNALGSLLTPWTKDVLDYDLETSSTLCTKNALRLYLTRILQNLNFARWPFLGSHLGHVEVMWLAQGCFLTWPDFRAKMVDLPIEPIHSKEWSKTNQTGGIFVDFTFFTRELGIKNGKKLRLWKHLHIPLLCSFG